MMIDRDLDLFRRIWFWWTLMFIGLVGSWRSVELVQLGRLIKLGLDEGDDLVEFVVLLTAEFADRVAYGILNECVLGLFDRFNFVLKIGNGIVKLLNLFFDSRCFGRLTCVCSGRG